MKKTQTPNELATRILNFVCPYIPDHIREEVLGMIKKDSGLFVYSVQSDAWYNDVVPDDFLGYSLYNSLDDAMAEFERIKKRELGYEHQKDWSLIEGTIGDSPYFHLENLDTHEYFECSVDKIIIH